MRGATMVAMETLNTSRPRWYKPLIVAAWAAGATGAYSLLTRHFDHVIQALPYLFLLACPLMHLFMHRGHGGHGGHGNHEQHPEQHKHGR